MSLTIGRVFITLQSFLYSGSMVVLLLGAGIYLSVRFGLFQLRGWRFVLKNTLGTIFSGEKKKNAQGISPFGAVSTALAGTMGVGNIAGVATALVAGGPGAIFWMWVSALFGMMTKYAEIYLSVRFRVRGKDGQYRGGPMYVMRDGLGSRRLGGVFALLCALCSLGIGNMTQVNAVSGAAQAAFGVPPWASGLLVTAVVALVVFGGVRRIASVNEMIIPFLSIAYTACSLSVLFHNRATLPGAVGLIFTEAFSLRSAAGGALGHGMLSAMRYGLSRGVFTNEAGLGSAPIAHAAADCKSPAHQSVWGIFEVFLDTVVVCTLTALVLLSAAGGELWQSGLDGVAMTSAAFASVFGPAGSDFIAISVLLFAVSSMLGWCYYGESALGYLTGQSPRATTLYRLLFLACILPGAMSELRTVWSLSDMLNALMAIPNVVTVLLLRGLVHTPGRESRRRR